MADPGALGAVFAALYAGHQLGDHWVQTAHQALRKHTRDWPGRAACARHTAGLTATKLAFLAAAAAVTGLRLHPLWAAAGLAVDALSHYWADRRFTLEQLCLWWDRFFPSARRHGFYRLGMPSREGEPPHLGTGAYALDQSWHVAWLFAAALLAVVGAR